jgi:hypothetical protein
MADGGGSPFLGRRDFVYPSSARGKTNPVFVGPEWPPTGSGSSLTASYVVTQEREGGDQEGHRALCFPVPDLGGWVGGA